MTFLDELRSVLATLKAQRARAFLTLLGIILGVGTLVVLSSAIEGLGKYMERSMQQAAGEDVINVSRRWWEDETGKAGVPLNRFDSRALESAETLAGAQVLNQFSMRVPWGERWGQNVWVVGTMPRALSFYGLELDKGRFISQGDVYAHTKVAVVGPEALKTLLPHAKDPLGQEIKLKSERFRVIGVTKKKPSFGKGSFRTWDGTIVVPETTFIDRFARSKDLREIVVKATPPAIEQLGIARLAYAVKAIVLGRHHGILNFEVTDPVKNAQSRAVVGLIVGGLEVAIALVCLGVGGINVMNIMLVTVTQRTREIGIRRAVGATQGSIRRQFLTEAAILSGLGGILGVVGGVVVAWGLAGVLNLALGYWPFIFKPLQASIGFGAALLTGIVFGWYPAHRAANLSPIECLRYE
ncbi:MAG TPA: ABC transporter permease [Stenomitos sp.]